MSVTAGWGHDHYSRCTRVEYASEQKLFPLAVAAAPTTLIALFNNEEMTVPRETTGNIGCPAVDRASCLGSKNQSQASVAGTGKREVRCVPGLHHDQVLQRAGEGT